MSLEADIADVTPGGNVVQTLLHQYGLGTLFAANVLGAGSVYILAQTGATTGFALLWVLPLAFALDMVMHDMSSRMAVDGRPLMEFIRGRLISTFGKTWGHRASATYAVVMALVMQLWAVANFAVCGAAISWFTGVNVYGCIAMASLVGIALVASRTYNMVEAVISALMVTVFLSYAALTLGLDVSVTAVASGLTPGGVSDATLIIAMLGTTVYYPNFFIQSSMRPTKGWVDLGKYRRDNMVGVGFSVLVSAGMLIVAAVTLGSGELSLTDPADPLVQMVGGWTFPVFIAAVVAASFTSGTGTLFGSSFAVPQSLGKETVFGDRAFTLVAMILITISMILAILALEHTNLTPVRMAIVMPALNGALFLPITIYMMYTATKDEMARWQKTVSGLAVVVMLGGSLLTAQSLYGTLVGWV